MKQESLMSVILGMEPLWLIEPRYAASAYARLDALDAATHGRDRVAGKPNLDMVEGVAIIEINGIMSKKMLSMEESTSTIEARRAVLTAGADDDIGALLLSLDTPGGTVSGTEALADAVRYVSTRKPVVAYAADMCCSAGLWVASQASVFYARASATVGSIGVVGALYDTSAHAARKGVRVIPLVSGKNKGTGMYGVPISSEQVEPYQAGVDGLAAQFISAVAKGRGLTESEVAAVADGSSWLAEVALGLGMIDGVQDDGEVLSLAVGLSERYLATHRQGRGKYE